MAKLLAILGVERERAVRCRSEGCNRPVHARIHVVEEDDGSILVLGSTCFDILYRGRLPGESVYTGTDSRKLTEQERRLLEENTEQLIAVFHRESEIARERLAQEKLERERLKRERLEQERLEWERLERERLERQKRAARAAPASPLHDDVPGMREGQPEPGRTVKCHFCGGQMKTLLPYTPAIGFKCQTCKDTGVTESLVTRKRNARRRW